MWVRTAEELGLQPDDNLYRWLVEPYSLSKVLKQLCKELSVQVISQSLAPASDEEQKLLNIKENNSLIREVYLCGDGTPWTMGRVVAPFATYQNHKQDLDNLGNNLLGETLLYIDPSLKRSPFEFTQRSDLLFSRRSVFTLKSQALLVTESYLNDLPTYPG